MTLVWRDEARADLRHILTYISQRNPTAAAKLQDAIEGCSERISERPYMYRPGRVEGAREAVVHPNYILIYRVTADRIEIVGVVHARQAYP